MVTPDNADITARIDKFKEELGRSADADMVQRFITSGECFQLNPESYFELKSIVSSEFGLHHSQVLIIGSAKLGFSIAPSKRFWHFRDESDIDVAIISDSLFDSVWKEVFEFWNNGGFWYKQSQSEFKDYLFRGWLRPDKMPPARSFKVRDRWWEFFRELAVSGKFGQYKLSGGL